MYVLTRTEGQTLVIGGVALRVVAIGAGEVLLALAATAAEVEPDTDTEGGAP